MKIGDHSGLNMVQINSFNRFLLDSTGKVLTALEAMLGVSIDSSDSSIDVSPAADNENLKHVGSGGLYTVSCEIEGDLQGQVLLLMRSGDFNYLSEVMRPILSLMFLSSPDTDLDELDKQMPDWMQDKDGGREGYAAYREHMLDTLAEMGNLLIGLYSKGIYRISDINTHHTVPQVTRDPDQIAIHKLLSSPQAKDKFHLVIENEFVMMGKPVKLWCLISPSRESFQRMLDQIDSHETNQTTGSDRRVH